MAKPARPPRSPIRKAASFEANALKVSDVCAFNMQTEPAFVYWLSDKIAGCPEQSRPVGWVIQNAAFEFNISTDTAKKYLLKHTAERAEFSSAGGLVTLKGDQQK